MEKFLILLHSDPKTWASLSPVEAQKALEKFVGWRMKLQDKGILLGSAKLADEPGKVLRGRGMIRVTDGPYSETKEVLGGYFMVEAANYEEAGKIAQECPGLEYNCTIELRQVDPSVPGK
jgi:hypothetical protein